ncbi:MAG: hypothetical protein KBA75_07190 [Alphaproteobacteria bacterium]|nr:hypothetical protein [Alphaproteobacteria bacterium]
MGDMKKPNPSRSRIIALSLAAAAVAFAPATSYADEKESGWSAFGSALKKGLNDIGTGIKQGIQQETGGNVGEKIAGGVQDGLAGKTPQPIGHVSLGNGGYITYFDNSNHGFSSRGTPLKTPPKAGTMPDMSVLIQTGKFKGQVVENNIDTMKKMGVFVATQPYLPPGGVTADGATTASVGKIPVAAQRLDLGNGKFYVNDPYNCQVVHVEDAKGNDLGTITGLSRSQQYFDVVAKCRVETQEASRKRMQPANRPTPAKKTGAAAALANTPGEG